MVASMTAFARGVTPAEQGQITFELKSVNHRYLEPHFRLHEYFRPYEIEFRNILKEHFSRGKVDVNLSFEPNSDFTPEMRVNIPLVKGLTNAAKQISDTLNMDETLNLKTILRWPGVLSSGDLDSDALFEGAKMGLLEVITQLKENRVREGEKLVEQIESRLGEMSKLVADARARYPEIHAGARDTLTKRLEEALDKIDNDRLEQELVHLAQRMDIAEELDRLDVHISETRTILSKSGAIGRRLDFIMQEFNREANTLGSKSQDTSLTKIAVELKVLIEQIREQIQNIE